MSREHLLAAIKAAPAEDTPRLMYADWLDEYGVDDRDRASAEFIRMSCKGTTGQRNAIDVKAGKWLYTANVLNGGAGRLCPRLANWMDEVNLNYHDARPDNPPERMPPEVQYMRDGRWLNLRHYRAGAVSHYNYERTDIEFWRGFVRRVVFRSWEEADVVLPKLLEDQPLCEPEFHNLIRSEGADRVHVWEGYVGKPVADHLMKLPFPFVPDDNFDGIHGGRRLCYDSVPNDRDSGVWKAAWRARWAVCMALRLAAEDVLAGRRVAGWPLLTDEKPTYTTKPGAA